MGPPYYLLTWGMQLSHPLDIHWTKLVEWLTRLQLPVWMGQSCYMYILWFYLHSHKVWQWATIQSNVLQLQVNSSIKILPREGCCKFSALRSPKNPKQHTAHSITWSCFRLGTPTEQTDRKHFRVTKMICRHAFTWLLPFSAVSSSPP